MQLAQSMEILKFIFYGAPILDGQGVSTRELNVLCEEGVSQSPWICVLAGNGSQLPGIPVPTTVTNNSQKQLLARPVLDTSDLPSHAQHLPSKVQDEHGWTACGPAPTCILCWLHSSGHVMAKISAQTVLNLKTGAVVGTGGAVGELKWGRDASVLARGGGREKLGKGKEKSAEAAAGWWATLIASSPGENGVLNVKQRPPQGKTSQHRPPARALISSPGSAEPTGTETPPDPEFNTPQPGAAPEPCLVAAGGGRGCPPGPRRKGPETAASAQGCENRLRVKEGKNTN